MVQRVLTEVSTNLASMAAYAVSLEMKPEGDTAKALKDGWVIKQVTTCIESGYHCATFILEKPD